MKKTKGQTIADEARKRGNKYSAEKRAELLKYGYNLTNPFPHRKTKFKSAIAAGKALAKPTKPQFNRKRVYRGWVMPSDVPMVKYENGDLKFMLFANPECGECPCRITVEWREK